MADLENDRKKLPEAVIFDFDGIIVDTEPLHYRAFTRILEPHGLGFSWEEYRKTYMGFDDRDAFLEAFSRHGKVLDDVRLSELVHKKGEAFQDMISEGVTPYPGVAELARKLKKSGIPVAICSGALLSDILPVLENIGLGECFNTIVTAGDVKKSKPDPESYMLACRRIMENISPPPQGLRAIAIEDTPAGIDSALGAGLHVIAVTNSYPPEYLSKASWVVDSLLEILDCFQDGSALTEIACRRHFFKKSDK